MGGWSGWYNTGKLCWAEISALSRQHQFLSGIPIWAAHYSYKSGGHKQCIGPACQCKINMVPGEAWTLRTTHGLYCIKLKHAETEWIYQLSFSSLSPQSDVSPLSFCNHFWGFKHRPSSDFISFKCENNDVTWVVIIRLSTLSQNKLNLPQILEIINFLPSLQHCSGPEWSEIAMF